MRTAIHEMRNHLAVATAMIEAFVDRKLTPTDARLTAVNHALHEVGALIDDLPRDRMVEFETRVEPINVCALIGDESAAMEGYAVANGVTLLVRRCSDVHPECQQFFGDPLRIGEIVTNVLTNAIRYAGSGGAVEVDCQRDGTSLRFSVSDDGPGIAEAERSRIYDPGFRGEGVAATAGTGVGLTLVKEFVERHGGTVDAVGRNGGGTVFTVRLPVVHAGCDQCAAGEPVRTGIVCS